MDQSSVSLVRLATIFALVNTCLYPMLRQAKMYKIRRPVSLPCNRGARCSSAVCLDHQANLAVCRPRSRRPSTTGCGQSRTYNPTKLVDVPIELAKSNLPNWDKYMTAYYIFSSAFNALGGLKYLVVCLLDTGTLRRDKYGHLDCLLIGRPTINPRVVNLLKYACLCAYCFHCLYYFFMLGRKLPFRIHCLEFLLMPPSEIEANQKNQGDDDEYCTLLSYATSFSARDEDEDEEEEGNEIETGVTKARHARPNRSPHAWRRLAKLITVWVGTMVGLFIVGAPIFCALVLPMIVTQPGFEATYDVCIRWIAGQDRSPSSLWWRQQVIDVPANYTFDSRLRRKLLLTYSEQWVEFSAYHKIRVAWDIIEYSIFMVQIYVALSIYIAPTLVVCADVSYYARQIDAAIQSIISDYHEDMTRRPATLRRSYMDQSMYEIYDNFPIPISVDGSQSLSMFVRTQPALKWQQSGHEPARTRRQHYRDRIAQVQAMTVDLFRLLRDYNPYAIYYVGFCTFIWYTYTFICSSWLFIPSVRHEYAMVESYFIQIVVTTIFLAIMGVYSQAGRACSQLYKTISSVTSLQEIDSAERERWIVIMKHFRPVPLHCFSIFRTSELSWMFVIKLTAWLFSTLFIIASFSISYGSFLHS